MKVVREGKGAIKDLCQDWSKRIKWIGRLVQDDSWQRSPQGQIGPVYYYVLTFYYTEGFFIV